jgi:iron complex transport system ATP-binding protein
MTPPAEFRSVRFAYATATPGGRASFALHQISFDVRGGEILGLIGPNSAGKTTIVRLLTKVLYPTGGEILLDGVPLQRLAARTVARQVAVVPQELPQAFPFTVEQLVLMGRYPHGPGRFFESDEDRAIAREAMTTTGVLDLASAPMESLSGGERQRAVIARALAQRPRLLILDEPTAHLDLRHQAACASLLHRLSRERGVTIMLVSHDLNLAADLCDRLLLLAQGRCVRIGSPDVVLEETALASAFGCPMIVEAGVPGPRVHVAWTKGGERRPSG